MTTLPIYERGNSIKTSITFKSGSTLIDPSGNKAFVNVIKPDGTYLVGNGSGAIASRTSTGLYHYYFVTSETDPLGIYTIKWHGNYYVGAEGGVEYNYKQVVQKSNIHIVNVDE